MTREELDTIEFALTHSARIYLESHPDPKGQVKEYLKVVFRILKKLKQTKEKVK